MGVRNLGAGRPDGCAEPETGMWGGTDAAGRREREPGSMGAEAASDGAASLELEGLRRTFGDVVALDGLSFSVPSGMLFGFVGRNGAGKTTTMRIVCGLLAADDGSVTWRGEAIDARVRQRIGYMPEERGLYPKMRARDQLEYFGVLHGLSHAHARRAAGEWLERLGLGDRAESRVEQLSQGNQQRVQLAAALVHGPDVLVLDEPFAGLDPIVCDLLTAVLREQAERGVPVLFSSHQLELVEHVCESVAIIDRGRLAACGPVDELRAGGPRVVRAEVRDASWDWTAELAGVEVIECAADGVVLELAPEADSQQVLDAARRAGRVTRFAEEHPTLAELFRDLVAA
jgi:ABC-2 type transport system ATP-binding protein